MRYDAAYPMIWVGITFQKERNHIVFKDIHGTDLLILKYGSVTCEKEIIVFQHQLRIWDNI